jgi:hypothetical protein
VGIPLRGLSTRNDETKWPKRGNAAIRRTGAILPELVTIEGLSYSGQLEAKCYD